MPAIGLILLAAGASTRLGTPKQLLPYAGQTLLRRAAETALASSCRPIVVVLGAYHERCRPELEDLPVRIIENSAWERGMGTSIRAGMEALLDESEEEMIAVVCMLCDQPFLSADTLNALVQKHQETGSVLVASAYGNALGVPALFHRSLFLHLLGLKGSEGAKSLIEKHRDAATAVLFAQGLVDVDTPDDYARLCLH